MAKSWATFGVDLHLEPAGPGLRRGLTDALREAVRTGRLAPGTRLPSSRALAADLGIARNTVADAYADLVAEGWLTARQGSGTRVADRAAPPAAAAPPHPHRVPGRPRYDLKPGTPDLASFPRAAWLKATRRALAAAPHDAFGYGDPRGRIELRTALADYLSRARGVRTDPDRIVVCAGFAQGLRLLTEALHRRGLTTLAVESYGLDVHWNLVEQAGLRTVPLPLDTHGTVVAGLGGEGVAGGGVGVGLGGGVGAGGGLAAGPGSGSRAGDGVGPGRGSYAGDGLGPGRGSGAGAGPVVGRGSRAGGSPDGRGGAGAEGGPGGFLGGASRSGDGLGPGGGAGAEGGPGGFPGGASRSGDGLGPGRGSGAGDGPGVGRGSRAEGGPGVRGGSGAKGGPGVGMGGGAGAGGAVLLTPAHQFPVGLALRPDRRAALVDWARRTGGLILEDDYDGEFRYDRRQPVGALQDLDPDHVAYLGTASKSLAPGLRLGWLVLPQPLVAEVAELGGARSTGVMEQLTLAEFISSGAYDRHLRAARLRYRRRRDALVAALAERAPEVTVTGIAAGLHAVLRLPPGTEQSVVRAAAWHGLAVHGLSHYRHPDARVDPLDALVIGYGTPPDSAWAGTLDALCAALP